MLLKRLGRCLPEAQDGSARCVGYLGESLSPLRGRETRYKGHHRGVFAEAPSHRVERCDVFDGARQATDWNRSQRSLLRQELKIGLVSFVQLAESNDTPSARLYLMSLIAHIFIPCLRPQMYIYCSVNFFRRPAASPCEF